MLTEQVVRKLLRFAVKIHERLGERDTDLPLVLRVALTLDFDELHRLRAMLVLSVSDLTPSWKAPPSLMEVVRLFDQQAPWPSYLFETTNAVS